MKDIDDFGYHDALINVVHELLHLHCENDRKRESAWLRAPHPALNSLSPNRAMRSTQGAEKVFDLLRSEYRTNNQI
ncbi:hypothetical protein GCM10011369_18670 [Neiella marina]|uniref:Antitoxin Xre/MbcA/ParS-like toxin-binding domain-containing protein n=1 Tax=Neiella marina TaxID=508461 RepID=A0A8J2U536_9GAMM|nr:antitoxin Xre/MbcA/ParS toxin-binding domain-containing protein [Neiella marina]GGA77035.1 hypothetical protein GCM10011369_18670 [Neiella marina]